jgi:hypothetical protein
MLHEALAPIRRAQGGELVEPPDSKETDLDALAKQTVDEYFKNKLLIPGVGHGIHRQGDPRAEKLFEVAKQTKVYGRYCDLIRKIGKLAEERLGRRLPVNVTGAIGAISMDMGFHWQMSKSFAILAGSVASRTSEKKFAGHCRRHFKPGSNQLAMSRISRFQFESEEKLGFKLPRLVSKMTEAR